MPQPTQGDVHVNAPLTNISVAFIQNQTDFIASTVFPNIPVLKQSDRYFTYPKEYWFRTEAALRGVSAESAGSGYAIDNTPSYYCDVWAVHKDVDDQIRANTDNPLDADRDSTLFVTQQLLLKRDLDWAASYFVTGIWGQDTAGDASSPSWPAGTYFWDDYTNGDPMIDIAKASTAMQKQTGFRPNVLVLGPEVYTALRNHPKVLDRIKYTQRGIVTTELLAALFDVDRIVVANAVKNTGTEGQTQTAANYSFVFGKSALLLYSNPTPSILTPSAGYTFTWTGLFGGLGMGMRINRFRLEWLKSDRVEGEMSYNMKVIAPELGWYFDSVVA
jgi:hypothetical protein